jgi:hypothetical protein
VDKGLVPFARAYDRDVIQRFLRLKKHLPANPPIGDIGAWRDVLRKLASAVARKADGMPDED